MKKIFSILCAAVMAVSASAAFVAPVKATKRAEDKFAPVAARPMPKKAVKRVAAEVADVTFTLSVSNLTATSARVDVVPSDNSALYYFDVMTGTMYNNILAGTYATYSINSVADYANYTIANNSYGVDAQTYLTYLGSTGADGYDYSGMTAASDYVLYAVAVDASYNCVEPAAVYLFSTPAKEAVVVTDTVNLHFASPSWKDYVASQGWWQVYGYNTGDSATATYYISLSNSETDELVGTYNTADMDAQYSYLYDMANEAEITFNEVTVVITEADSAIVIVADYVGDNGTLYHITFDAITVEAPVEPEPEDPVEPTGDTIQVIVPGVSSLTDATASEGWFEFVGSTETYAEVVLDIASDHIVGTYDYSAVDCDYTFLKDSTGYIEAVSNSANWATVSQSGDTLIAEAFFLAKDGNYYHVVMKNYVPTPEQTINATINDGAVDAETYAGAGYTLYQGQNDSLAVRLFLPQGAGTYTLNDIYGMNSSYGSYLGDMTTMYIINIMSATITVNTDGSFVGSFITADAIEYVITFVPVVTSLEGVDAANGMQKMMKNGQLLIKKDGKLFNAQGMKL